MTEQSQKIKVNFVVNDVPAFSKKILKTQTLSELRKEYGNLIKDDYIFLTNDKFTITKEDESDYIVEESLLDNKIYIKHCKDDSDESTEQSSKTNEIILSTPIEGSSFIYEKNNLNIYLYKGDILTKEEEERAIVLMVVGQTGCGKTTLLNAFANYLFGIKY